MNRWTEDRWPGVPREIDVPEESLLEALDAASTQWPDRVVVDFMGEAATYRELAKAGTFLLAVPPMLDKIADAAEGTKADLRSFTCSLVAVGNPLSEARRPGSLGIPSLRPAPLPDRQGPETRRPVGPAGRRVCVGGSPASTGRPGS